MNAIELGRVFADPEVAALYRYRPPYPREVFAILARIIVEPRFVLDAGAGTGALGRILASSVTRVDALDPSPAMVAHGRELPGGDDPHIRWIEGRAEDAPLSPPYGLIVAGAALHWMELGVVLPRFRAALAPDALLAIVDTEAVHSSDPLRVAQLDIIRRYSPLQDHVETPDMVATLLERGLFALQGEQRTAPVAFEQSIDDALHRLHSTSTLSRVTLGDRLEAFDSEMRAAFNTHGVDRARFDVVGYVAWGRPA
jgi:SAM-dependent methyltransferase